MFTRRAILAKLAASFAVAGLMQFASAHEANAQGNNGNGNGNGGGNNGGGGGNGTGNGNGGNSGGGNGNNGNGNSASNGKSSSAKNDTTDTPDTQSTAQPNPSLELRHANGITETLRRGRYSMHDNKGRVIVDRPATTKDRSRFRASR